MKSAQRLIIGLFCFFQFVPLSKSVAQEAKPEFRAAWIATVDNIDWPNKGEYNTANQRQQFIDLLEMHKRNGLNAVVVQIRPSADAFYPSSFEPWSQWLTGTQGKPPVPYYDPLQFMIAETHKRGMAFHAWCNPYRAEFLIGKSSIAQTHITKVHPEWFLPYGDKRYFDPGNKEVQKFVTEVIRDVVSRYAVDGIHFDDYFYPYRIAGKEFPDNASYAKYGNGMSKDDWRRSNVDSIIVSLNKAIKETNPACVFGISPFGVWRNKDKDPEGSETKAGQTNYDDLYADILLWLKEGWIDYVAPQLYWEIGFKVADYTVLLDWWSKHTYGKHCYIGLGVYRANTNAAWRDKTQLPRQIEMLRNTPNVQGMIFFSSKSFVNNPNGWSDSLRLNYFKDPAPLPTMDWIK
ncbi:glycoside hydrolase family 10 protein [Pinibacter aurantiacus]|uniref:Family 10 glycosylhydrolase n=1 Tax=Pinibacter aurantiacus TaxID=2851599 RepID=A0A9E2SAS3_9BACT|nr:family 10 glycosylhydrolase [Pinibacter aurantiacus]MBV4357764.1 family 10 glycosylhydrolase [Pinibacter aurantiacus]